MQLEKKRAVITGGTSGIGLETAKLFKAQGARVAVTGRDAGRLTAAGVQLGETVLTIQADATSLVAMRDAYAKIGEEWGGFDILFVNAGVAFPAPLESVTNRFIEDTFAINFKGSFFAIQQAIPFMPRGSSIVLNTSWLGETGLAGTSILSASKAALRSLARTLSAELLPKGIRVNAVSPGAISTEIYSKMKLSEEQLSGLAGAIEAQIPLRRFGSPADIAQAALFLASDASAYMLGSEISVDGGLAQL